MQSILQLAQLYRDFLDGNSMIPTYLQPLIGLEADTKDQLSIFKKINELSFITTDSQDGLEDSNNTGLTIQRAYIQGYMPTIIAEAMMNDLALSDIIFMTKPNEYIESFCDIEKKYPEELPNGIFRIPVTVEKNIKGEQILHSNIPGIVDCNSQKLLIEYLDKASPGVKEVFVKEFSTVVCFDTVWKRSNYLANTIATRLEKVIKSLSVMWDKSCTIFTSFDDDKLLENIKTYYPELKISKENKLTKTELCLILSFEEIRSMITKDGIQGLKQIGENFKKINKEETIKYLKDNEINLIIEKTNPIAFLLSKKFKNSKEIRKDLKSIRDEFIDENFVDSDSYNNLSLDEKINLVNKFMNETSEKWLEKREIGLKTIDDATKLSEKLKDKNLEDKFWDEWEEIKRKVLRLNLNTEEKIRRVIILQNELFERLNENRD